MTDTDYKTANGYTITVLEDGQMCLTFALPATAFERRLWLGDDEVAAIREYVEAHPRPKPTLPKGVVQFPTGQVAAWDKSILAWSITGSPLAYGDPNDVLRVFGTNFVVLVPSV